VSTASAERPDPSSNGASANDASNNLARHLTAVHPWTGRDRRPDAGAGGHGNLTVYQFGLDDLERFQPIGDDPSSRRFLSSTVAVLRHKKGDGTGVTPDVCADGAGRCSLTETSACAMPRPPTAASIRWMIRADDHVAIAALISPTKPPSLDPSVPDIGGAPVLGVSLTSSDSSGVVF